VGYSTGFLTVQHQHQRNAAKAGMSANSSALAVSMQGRRRLRPGKFSTAAKGRIRFRRRSPRCRHCFGSVSASSSSSRTGMA